MKHTLRCLATVFVIAAAAALAAAQQPGPSGPIGPAPDWKVFTPTSGLFTIQFPAAPAYIAENVDQGFHKAVSHRYKLDRTSSEGSLYEVSHMQLPPNDGDIPPALLLDATIDTVLSPLAKMGGKELGRADASSNGCAGKEYRVVISNEAFMQGRIIIVGDQIVNAFFVAPTALRNHKQIAWRFLNSLSITKGCAAAPAPTTPPPAAKKTGTVSGSRDAATGWRLIAPPQSGFSVLMPSAAESEEEAAQVKPFPLMLRSYFAQDDTTVYGAVECGDFPEETSRIEQFDEIKLNIAFRSMEEQATALGAKITLEGNAPFGGFPARQYRLNTTAGAGRALIVSTPRKFFLFIAFNSGDARQAAKVERFFNSIKLEK